MRAPEGWYHGQQSSPNMHVFANFSECPVEPAVSCSPPPHVRATASDGWAPSTSIFLNSDQIGFGTKGQKRAAWGGKGWTWIRPFARPRPSSTSDEGGSAVPNSRLITAVIIWISRTPMGDAGPLSSTQTTTTATAMRQRQGHRETKRAPHGKWNGRRVEGDGNFGAQYFP